MTERSPRENALAYRREQLRYWPYTIHQIDETLDIGLIEGKAKQILFQALNARSICAFGGSGLSASYGRLSWSDWKDEQIRVVRENTDAFLALAADAMGWVAYLRDSVAPLEKRPAGAGFSPQVANQFDPDKGNSDERGERQRHRHNVWRWLDARHGAILEAKAEIQRLQVTFQRATSRQGKFPGGEALPIEFEIAQQLHDQLRRFVILFAMSEAEKKDDDPQQVFGQSFWAGSRDSKESAAPREGLKRLKAALGEKINDWHSTHPKFEYYSDSWNAFSRVDNTGASGVSFEQLAKFLLVDECSHAAILLRKGLERDDNATKLAVLEKELNLFDSSKLKRDLDSMRDNPERYAALSPFTFLTLDRVRERLQQTIGGTLAETAAADWQVLIAKIENRLKVYVDEAEEGGDDRVFLTPTSRFILSMYLRLIEKPFECFAPEVGDGGLQERCGLSLIDVPSNTSFSSRRSIIADRFDPLAKTIRRLGIRQYITTNYDFEIERFFEDAGYRRFGPKIVGTGDPLPVHGEDDFRSDHLGAVLRDQTFKRDRAAELVAFSVGRNRVGASVFHLHGRATKDDGLVISERDYLDLYLSEDNHRDTVDEAIDLAFSSGPVLFLGLGMTEADMLRPLRQFISDQDRTVGYSAITLLPAKDSYDERVKTASALYLRYGVHTIFYGSGTINVGGTPVAIDWLHRILTLVSTLTAVTDRWLKQIKDSKALSDLALSNWPKALIEELDEALGKVGADLSDQEGLGENDRVLNLLMGRTGDSLHTDSILQSLTVTPTEDAKYSLSSPTFTPVRPQAERAETRHKSGRQKVVGEPYVGFYLRMLEDVLRMFVTQQAVTESDQSTFKRDLGARKIMLDGLWDAFLGTTMNAALEGIENEWRAWWEDWQDPPPHRIAKFENQSFTAETGPISSEESAAREAFLRPKRFVRHRVDSVITDMSGAEITTCPPQLILDDRGTLAAQVRTHIRSFDTFVAAVAEQRIKEGAKQTTAMAIAAQKRSFFTVAARRGQGKGTFMSALSSRLGLSLYTHACWPQEGIVGADGTTLLAKTTDCRVVIAAAIFINYSFSSEIASTYDMIIAAVQDATQRLRALDKIRDLFVAAAGNTSPSLNSDEAEIFLRAVLEDRLPNAVPENVKGVWNLYISYHDSLREQSVKEADTISRLGSLSECLTEFKRASAAIDDICAGTHPGKLRARLVLSINAVNLLFWPDGTPKNKEIGKFIDYLTGCKTRDLPLDLVVIGSEGGLGRPWNVTARDSNQSGQNAAQRRQLKLRQIDRKNLPRAAAEHIDRRRAASTIDIVADEGTESLDGYLHFARPVSPMSMLVSNFPFLAKILFLRNTAGRDHLKSKIGGETLSPLGVAARIEGRKAVRNAWAEPNLPGPDVLRKALDDAPARKRFSEALDLAVKKAAEEEGLDASQDVSILLRARYRQSGNSDAKEWHLIRRHLGGSRFCLTILLAAAQHMVGQARDLHEGASAAEAFIRGTVDQVRNVGDHRKEDLVLESVLECYRRYNVISYFDADIELHLLLIRHLAVIGTPVSTAVLVRLPEVRDYFARLRDEPEVSRRRTVAAALTILCERGLVFRLSPNPSMLELKDEDGNSVRRDWPLALEFRYALHRVVQRHAASLLGQGRVDPVRNNSFAPTLYASMSSGGPRLSREAYVFLRRQMVALSQYPDIPNAERESNPMPFVSNDREIPVQALRAALSLARASFSVASISRFADYKRLIPGTETRGYLETYKVRLRWIIRRAWELNHIPASSGGSTDDGVQFNALYRDEVVWLYNELGVTSLAQGNLTDALALLRQAAEFNAAIEGSSRSGEIGNLIGLNHAIVQMERGRLASARTRLSEIQERTRNIRETEYHMAMGYLCVLDHLSGRSQDLYDRFEQVTNHFQRKGDKRAAAIFLHHSARFLRESNADKAGRLLRTARELAETGGHEDIRHHVQVAEILVEHANISGAETRGPKTYARLREIETFGRRMGVWSLQCDSLLLHARILLEQGETANAGRLLVRALAIAHRCSMTLRANRGLTLYAELLRCRGDKQGAETVAITSLELAKSSGFSLETVRAQSVLAAIHPV